MAKQVTDEYTGLSFDISTPEGAIEAQIEVNKLLKSLDKTKANIRNELEKHENYEHDGHQIKVYHVQRKNYDPTVLRQEIDDEDLLWQMFQPNKTWIDKYLMDNLEDLGGVSTALRKSMVVSGNPYTTVKLIKLSRD